MPRCVRVMDRSSQRFDEPHGLSNRHRRAIQLMGEASPLNELHAQVGAAIVLTDLIDGNDLGMIQQSGRLCLVAKALPFGRRGKLACQDHLHGDQTVKAFLTGLVDDAHAPAGDLLQQLVVVEFINRCGNMSHRASCPTIQTAVIRRGVAQSSG